jgi:hypothetical protein
MRRFRLTPLRLVVAILLGSVSFAGVAYAASLGLASKQLYVWSQTLTKASCNQSYATADDTFASKANPTNVYGSPTIPTTLFTYGGTTFTTYTFIRFDLSGCNLPTTAGADNATLTLFVTSATGDTISLYPVYSSWSSSTLTWNGVAGLSVGATPTTSFVASAGFHTVTVTADVDAAIKAGTLWGWELQDPNANATQIASSTYATTADRPSLTLSYEK